MDDYGYQTELIENMVSNLANKVPTPSENPFSIFESIDSNMSFTGSSQHLASILEQLFSGMSGNETSHGVLSTANLLPSSSDTLLLPSLSFVSSLPSAANGERSYYLLSVISFWFVLIINPIVILFGVIGNGLTTYILINCNIAKLPVSFYTIMLNISDTLNLVIPVFIFWLDNCFNRTLERGYFRDKSNFLCKALMCPDQLFAALSAWYMCAISFNRWYSVCRPSSYFFRTAFSATRRPSELFVNNRNGKNRLQKRNSSGSQIRSASVISFSSSLRCCCSLARSLKYRQHIRAFRSIGIITLLGILCCLYPIFMHEIRPIVSTNKHEFDLTKKITRTYAVVWKRCYYSQKHEYAYDIIGIILSTFLHVLPLTFVGAMNIMIILSLRQRQNTMINSGKTEQPARTSIKKKQIPLQYLPKKVSFGISLPSPKEILQCETDISCSKEASSTRPTMYKNPPTSTDLPSHLTKSPNPQTISASAKTISKRHQSRDRTITIMLVSVALSYLILTLPYRLFWLYNVYMKRMYPGKLNSSIYLLKMHYIDHFLRTIRNIHYGTNFIFFIFLSKAFRRNFRQLFIDKILHLFNRLFHRNPRSSQDSPTPREIDHILTVGNEKSIIEEICGHGTSSTLYNPATRGGRLHFIMELEHDDLDQE